MCILYSYEQTLSLRMKLPLQHMLELMVVRRLREMMESQREMEMMQMMMSMRMVMRRRTTQLMGLSKRAVILSNVGCHLCFSLYR